MEINDEKVEISKLMCGLVMPISEIDGCSENHWKDVYNILCEAIEKAGFNFNLVSRSDDVGVIQKRIIQNLYENPIVVCDVSGKNPNVMFELGVRLAFDKPTIIVKDDKTNYSFDTSPIEHLEYPRDLRFSKIVEFKERLSEKIIQTYKKATTDENYSTFLKHFGSFKIAKIETEVVSKEDYILEEIKNLREIVLRNNRKRNNEDILMDYENERILGSSSSSKIVICFGEEKPVNIEYFIDKISNIRGVNETIIDELSDNHCHVIVRLNGKTPKSFIKAKIEDIVGDKASYVK